jgi:hypothetical protein
MANVMNVVQRIARHPRHAKKYSVYTFLHFPLNAFLFFSRLPCFLLGLGIIRFFLALLYFLHFCPITLFLTTITFGIGKGYCSIMLREELSFTITNSKADRIDNTGQLYNYKSSLLFQPCSFQQGIYIRFSASERNI